MHEQLLQALLQSSAGASPAPQQVGWVGESEAGQERVRLLQLQNLLAAIQVRATVSRGNVTRICSASWLLGRLDIHIRAKSILAIIAVAYSINSAGVSAVGCLQSLHDPCCPGVQLRNMPPQPPPQRSPSQSDALGSLDAAALGRLLAANQALVQRQVHNGELYIYNKKQSHCFRVEHAVLI